MRREMTEADDRKGERCFYKNNIIWLSEKRKGKMQVVFLLLSLALLPWADALIGLVLIKVKSK